MAEILVASKELVHIGFTFSFTFTFGAHNRNRSVLGQCMFAPMSKGREDLLVAVANRWRVVDLTLANSSGPMRCASMFESSYHRHYTSLKGGKRFPPLLIRMLGTVDQLGSS